MMTTSEKTTQKKSITLPLRSVHHTSLIWALCQELVLSTTQRFVAVSIAGLPFWTISAFSLRSSSRSRVALESYVATVQMHLRPLGQISQRLANGVQDLG